MVLGWSHAPAAPMMAAQATAMVISMNAIMNGPATFYHAETSKGTNLSPFNSYWRAKACGFRRIPKP